MALVTFISHRGSPGTTSLAVAVAGAWPTTPERGKVLIEADPAGGVLALRLGLSEDPGLVSFAAAARHGMRRGDLWEHAQTLSGGLGVVPGPASIAVADQLLAASGTPIGKWLAQLDEIDVLVDAGRMSPSSAASSLVFVSDVVVMVARPVADQLHPASMQLGSLRDHGVSVGWCLSGTGPYVPAEVEDAYGIPVFGIIPTDSRGAHMLFGGTPARRLSRTPLVRAASTLADHLSGWLHDPVPRGTAASLEGDDSEQPTNDVDPAEVIT